MNLVAVETSRDGASGARAYADLGTAALDLSSAATTVRGSVAAKHVPVDPVETKVTSPPCARAMRRAMARPSPVPPA
jgi:hypothetical protein